MKGLDDMTVRAMEERVRDAFGAAAETVTARDLPGPPTPAGHARAARGLRAWAPRARMHAFIPLAAAAGVTVIIVTAILVVPRLLAGPPSRPQGGALAAAPKFFAGVAENPRGQGTRTTVVNIYRSATGRVVGSIRPPKPYHDFVAVSRLGGDRTFVAAVITAFGPTACTSHLFHFSIDGQGHPSRLTPLSVPQVTGEMAELVSSADGKAVAYTVSGCPRAQAIGVINLATRQTTTWKVPHHGIHPVIFGSLSLTENGSRLGFVVGSPAGPVGPTNAYVLPTDSPSGPLMRHARKVLHVPTGVFRVVLSNNGSRAWVETQSAPRGGAVVLSQYSTTTGQRVRLLGQLGPGGRFLSELSITVDAAGKHLLAYSDVHRVTAVNLTTGHQASITAAQIPYLDGAYNTAAW
jgi:hypothetical protein